MKHLESLKTNCFNHQAQTFTELATFGTVLLVVLSFFVRYALSLRYNQEIDMRTFRTTLLEAYKYKFDTPHGNANLVIVEDKHIPEPRDSFGIGDITTVESSADITWGNSLYTADYVDQNTGIPDRNALPTMSLTIDGANMAHPGLEEPPGVEIRGWTTEEFHEVTQAIYPGGFWVELPEQPRQHISWDRVRVYRPDPDLTDSDPGPDPQPMVRLLPTQDTELIDRVAIEEDGPLLTIVSLILPGKAPAQAVQGDSVIGFVTLDSSLADINPLYMQPYSEIDPTTKEFKVTIDNMQGLLPVTDVHTVRNDSLNLAETPGAAGNYTSVSNVKSKSLVNHKYRDNIAPNVINHHMTVDIGEWGAAKTWQTAK